MQFTVPEELSTDPKFLHLYAKFLEDVDELKTYKSDYENAMDLFCGEKTPYQIFQEIYPGTGLTITEYYFQFKEWFIERYPTKKFNGYFEFLEEMGNHLKTLNQSETELYSRFIRENSRHKSCNLQDCYSEFVVWFKRNFPEKTVPYAVVFNLNYLYAYRIK